ncbi:MAG: hypothetical protein CMJ83_08060, partial [Planctomycetes bacterium]|nr:hypothetical protein [Planctomycetota bacterium]
NRVTFRAATGENVVFDAAGAGHGIFFGGADYVTIEGIEIMNAPFDGVSLYSEAQHGVVFDAVIRRCRIHDCGATGVLVYGNSARPSNTVIENNFFWNLQMTNAGGFNSLARFGYVSGRRHDGTRVLHNTFYVSTGTGSAFCVIGDMPSGTETRFVEISNNVIHKTAGPTRPIYSFPLAGATGVPALVNSNCYWDPSGGPFSAGAVVSANFAAWVAATGQDTTSFSIDPVLVAPIAGDLHLDPNSPCVNASSVLSTIIDDIDGEPRAGTFDIGADEVSCTLPLFETNDAASYLDVDGVQGTSCTPAISARAVGTTGTASFQSTNVGMPYEVVLALAPLLPASAGVPVTANGQLLNVDITSPSTTYFNGGAAPSFAVLFPFSFIAPWTAPATPVTIALQMANFDPTHPDGFAISQGCQADVQ